MARAKTAVVVPLPTKSRAWPADTVERRPVASLIPYARNARTHTEEQVAQIAASIVEWGWTTPVLVDEDGVLLSGHGRVLAARKLGLDDVPAMVAVNWSEEQKRAYTLADNRLALSGGWDEAMLRIELIDLRKAGADLTLIGFTDHELKKVFGDPVELDGASGLTAGLQFQVIVDCRDEQDQAETLERIKADGRECRPLTL